METLIGNVSEDKLNELIYLYHKEKHPRMYKRWMLDLAKREEQPPIWFKPFHNPLNEEEKELLAEARKEGII